MVKRRGRDFKKREASRQQETEGLHREQREQAGRKSEGEGERERGREV